MEPSPLTYPSPRGYLWGRTRSRNVTIFPVETWFDRECAFFQSWQIWNINFLLKHHKSRISTFLSTRRRWRRINHALLTIFPRRTDVNSYLHQGRACKIVNINLALFTIAFRWKFQRKITKSFVIIRRLQEASALLQALQFSRVTRSGNYDRSVSSVARPLRSACDTRLARRCPRGATFQFVKARSLSEIIIGLSSWDVHPWQSEVTVRSNAHADLVGNTFSLESVAENDESPGNGDLSSAMRNATCFPRQERECPFIILH